MKNQVAFFLVLAVLAVLAAWMLVPFVAPILIAVVTGYLLTPVFDAMGRKVPSKDLRALLLLMLIFFAVALPVLLALVEISQQVPAVLRQNALNDSIVQVNETLDKTLGRHIPIAENLEAYTVRVREWAVAATPGLLGHLGATAVDLVVFMYVLFYVFTDGPKLLADFVSLIPLDAAMKPHLLGTMEATMTGVLYGQVVTAVAQAALAGIGYAVVGLPHLLLWTLLTFIAAMMPVAGGALVWLPLALSRFAVGHKFGAWGLLVYMSLLVTIIENVIKPRLISGRAPLHPLAALLGVLGGLYFFGITGFLIGPVLLGLLSAMLRFYRETPQYKQSALIG